ncbi:MAG TPA: hypothetical protein VIL36_18010 [Acidimicrobiales bacterium]
MRAMTMFVTFVVAILVFASAAVRPGAGVADDDGQLLPGQQLAPGQELVSEDGRFVLDMQRDGNLVLRGSDGGVLWETGTAALGSSLVVQVGGNVVVTAPSGAPQWSTGTGDAGHVTLELRDDGRLVVVDQHGTERWSTPTVPVT